MTHPLTIAARPTVLADAARRALARACEWLTPLSREPLIHFLLLGALVFGVDHGLARLAGDPRTITVGAEVDTEARELFRASMQRDPSAAEMTVMRERWVDNEVLYRDALALGLDRGDAAIRERLIFKALSITQSGLNLPPIDEAGLKGWFEAHRAKYDEPARFDFLEAVVVGDSRPETVRDFVAAIVAGKHNDTPGDLRVFKARPRPNLVQSYGAEFTAALEALPVGQWAALASREGLRAVRLESHKPGVASAYEAVAASVYADWKEDTMQRMTSAAIRAQGRKYRVEIAGAAK
jgi:hypothetical protein